MSSRSSGDIVVTTIGYYCVVSLTLNAFEIPLPESWTDPFPDES